MLNISLKDYIKQEVKDTLDYCEEVENLAEDFEVDEDIIYSLIENIEEEVAEAIDNNEYYHTIINEWIADEIRDVIKKRILKTKGE